MNWTKLLSYQRLDGKDKKISQEQDIRSEFEKDYDRIIFSYPFRRLQDKTQVIPLPEKDFVHTRLTHSLEVSSVGRTLGKLAGEFVIAQNPELKENGFTKYDFGAIVAAACLAHDLGNPPFGHSGEDAISEFFIRNPIGQSIKEKIKNKEWTDFTKFEGNAQGFRILNNMNLQGLKLTSATLAAFTKYPRESSLSQVNKSRRSQKKYGFFQSEKEIFNELATETGLLNLSSSPQDLCWSRHPLAFLVEAADDICYLIIDLEDACRMGFVPFDVAKELLVGILGDSFNAQKFDKMSDLNEKLGLLRAMVINKLVDQAAEVFRNNEKKILTGDFDTALTELLPAKDIMNDIISLSIEKIYNAPVVVETQAAGFEVISGLLETFSTAVLESLNKESSISARHKNIIRLIPPPYYNKDQTSVYLALQNIIDYTSGMTDSYAISLYRKIKGISLSK